MDCILQKGGASYDEMQGGIWVPGTSDVVLVPAETVPLTDVVMAGEPNFTAENIRYGVSMWGEVGTCNDFYPVPGYYLDCPNEYIPVTGGYGGGSNKQVASALYQEASVTKTEAYINLTAVSGCSRYQSGSDISSGVSNYYTNAWCMSGNKVDVTGVAKIKASGLYSGVSLPNGNTGVNYGYIMLGLCSSRNLSEPPVPVAYSKKQIQGTVNNAELGIELNTRSLTGSYYILIRCGQDIMSSTMWGAFSTSARAIANVKKVEYETMYVES